MPVVEINISDKRFYLPLIRVRSFCKKCIDKAWEKAHEPSIISLTLTNDDKIKKLNRRFRKKNKPTNVLSFENPHKPAKREMWAAGDLVLSFDTLKKEAIAQHISFRSHMAHLLIHGCLHLQGYDHMTDKEAEKMERLETKMMQELGYDDPYQGE